MAIRLALCLAVLACACGPASPPAAAASPSPTPSIEVASPSPSPTPSQAPVPAQPPATMAVTFTGLPSGSYITHLHSACSGLQQFHVTVLQTLVVSGGSGTIQVSSGYFGRGLCVIVYSSPALTSVLATKRI